MNFVSQTWAGVKLGIIVVLATRTEQRITSSGEFIVSLVAIFGIALIIYAVQQEFLVRIPPKFAQFETLRDVGVMITQLIALYLVYVLSAAVQDWFTSKFLNGPYVLELVLVVVLIILMLTVIGMTFTRYTNARPRHVKHLLEISNAEVQIQFSQPLLA